jgi:hypothetical protein
MCGSPSSNSIAAYLASEIPIRSGTTVKHAAWDSSSQQWQLSGAVGVHKDAVAATKGSSDELEDLGVYDALVLADAATMRPGSAGFVTFEADSPGSPHLALHYNCSSCTFYSVSAYPPLLASARSLEMIHQRSSSM